LTEQPLSVPQGLGPKHEDRLLNASSQYFRTVSLFLTSRCRTFLVVV